MAHGGPRPGAGRRQGSAVVTKTRKIAEAAMASGQTPLEFMLSVMRDEKAERSERLDMAKAAAPYIHPRLSNVEATTNSSVETVSEVRWSIVDPLTEGP